MKIFNLNLNHNFGLDLQQNLKELYSTFGKIFIIKYDKIKIKCKLQKIKLQSEIKYYELSYEEVNRSTRLFPFKIDFINIITLELDNNSYIANIQSTKDISGSNMVKLCLKINKILGTKKTLLYDGATIYCNNEKIDLSFLKLLQNKMTFYMKLGFDIDITNKNISKYTYFSNSDKLISTINELIRHIRKIRIKDILNEFTQLLHIYNQAYIENNKHNLKIILDNSTLSTKDSYLMTEPYNNISESIKQTLNVIQILNKYAKIKYLYKLLIYLFNNECTSYIILLNNIIYNNKLKIIYGKYSIKSDYLKYFKFLLQIRHEYMYSYTFY